MQWFVRSNITLFSPLMFTKKSFKFVFKYLCYCPDFYVEMSYIFMIFLSFIFFKIRILKIYARMIYFNTGAWIVLYRNRYILVVYFHPWCNDSNLWNQWLDGNIFCETFKCICNCISETSFVFLSLSVYVLSKKYF